MTRLALAAALAGSLVFVAPADAGTEASSILNPLGLPFAAGLYRCELNRTVQVRDVAPDMSSATFKWNDRDYRLQGVVTQSGAVRFEDADSGLVWITIRGKSILLDSKQGRQLANECKV